MKLWLIVSIPLTLTTVPAAATDTRCPGVTIRSDSRGPDAGAKLGIITLRPRFMAHFSDKVQLFIAYHECAHAQGIALGHKSIKADEILADKTAFERAFAEGWMTPDVVTDICKSWGNDPASSTHPSAKRRCTNLRGWFAAAEAKKAAAS